MTRNEMAPGYLLSYTAALVMTPAIHFVVFGKMEAHPTVHLSIGLVVFTAILALLHVLAARVKHQRVHFL